MREECILRGLCSRIELKFYHGILVISNAKLYALTPQCLQKMFTRFDPSVLHQDILMLAIRIVVLCLGPRTTLGEADKKHILISALSEDHDWAG